MKRLRGVEQVLLPAFDGQSRSFGLRSVTAWPWRPREIIPTLNRFA
jgi:hypothetical protein